MVYFEKKQIQLTCQDGIILHGLLLTPDKPKAVIQINSATAVAKEFYLGIAAYLANNDYACLLFDYRGICSSKPKEGLKDCNYELTDWGRQDMVAGIQFIKSTFPELPILFLSHSVGGQMIHFAQNINEISGMVAVSTSSGYTGHMSLMGRLKAFYFFQVIRRIIHLRHGYSKLKTLGFMEDMPKSFTNTWYQWCRNPQYFFDTEYLQSLPELGTPTVFNFPMTFFTATDDEICSKKNVENFCKHAKTTESMTFKWLNPLEYGLKNLGHFNFFRSTSKNKLWPLALTELEKYYEQATAKK